MVQVFEKAVNRKAFSLAEIAILRDAYLSAEKTLDLNDNAERRRLAKIVQKIARLEALPTAPVLAQLATDLYISEQASN